MSLIDIIRTLGKNYDVIIADNNFLKNHINNLLERLGLKDISEIDASLNKVTSEMAVREKQFGQKII